MLKPPILFMALSSYILIFCCFRKHDDTVSQIFCKISHNGVLGNLPDFSYSSQVY